MKGRRVKGLVLAAVMVGAAACATMGPAKPAGPTLYKRLGGREGIALVVDDFVGHVLADGRVNARFRGLDPPRVSRLKSHLADFLCDAAGGPCSYVGRDMKTAHRGMGITDAEWDATVEALVKALAKHRVAERDQQELLAVLARLKPDIVGQ
jgi:hemoglobin